MIVDNFSNSVKYRNIHSGFDKAFDFLEECLENNLETGRYEIDSDRVYALVQSYETSQPDYLPWESHEKYIDIQFVAEGREVVGWKNTTDLTPVSAYDTDEDCVLYKPEDGTGIVLGAEYFAIFFPWDGHRPKGFCDKPAAVKKVVIKVAVYGD